MSRSNEFKEQGFACRCSVTDSQFGDLAASVPSPVELVSLVFACPLPRCEIERNAGSCRADPTRSARWPARVNLAAFWQQIAPIVPFLPTLPTAKYCTVCYLQIAAHLDTEEVAGSNPVVPTIIFNNLRPTSMEGCSILPCKTSPASVFEPLCPIERSAIRAATRASRAHALCIGGSSLFIQEPEFERKLEERHMSALAMILVFRSCHGGCMRQESRV